MSDLSGAPIWVSALKAHLGEVCTEPDIRHALRNFVQAAQDPFDGDVVLFLGADTGGRMIEVGVLYRDEGPVIIHSQRPVRPHRFEQG